MVASEALLELLNELNGNSTLDQSGVDNLFTEDFPYVFDSDLMSNQAGPSSVPLPRTQANERSSSAQPPRLTRKRPQALFVDDDQQDSNSNSVEPHLQRKRLRRRRDTPRHEPLARRIPNAPLNSVPEIIIIEDDEDAFKDRHSTADGSTTRSLGETSDENSRSVDSDIEFLHETTRSSSSTLDQPSGSSSLATELEEFFSYHEERNFEQSTPENEDSIPHHRTRRRKLRNSTRLQQTIEPGVREDFPLNDRSLHSQRTLPPSHTLQTNSTTLAGLRNFVAASRIPHNTVPPRMTRDHISFGERIINARHQVDSIQAQIRGYRDVTHSWQRRPGTWGLMGQFMLGAGQGFPPYHEAAFGLNLSYEELLRLSEAIGPAVSRGLPPDVLAKLAKTKFTHDRLELPGSSGEGKEPESCIICWETYKVGEDLVQLPCNHEYHHGCIKQWLGKNATCPMCRTTISG